MTRPIQCLVPVKHYQMVGVLTALEYHLALGAVEGLAVGLVLWKAWKAAHSQCEP